MVNDINLTAEEREALDKFGLGSILDDNIVTEDELNLLRGMKKIIPTLRDELNRATQAGIDIGTRKTDLATAEQRVDDILRLYDTK